jgi:Trk K+ transport system NAD-binding subunit
VVAVERDPDARCLPLAKERRIPVVLGRGADRFLLQRAGVTGARAVAAVSSDGLENISVAVTARAVAPRQRIVLRAGGAHDIMDESRSLFHIGAVCDVPQIAGALVAAHAVDAAAIGIFTSRQGQIYAAFGRDDIVRLADWNVPRADHASAVEDDVIDGAIAS